MRAVVTVHAHRLAAQEDSDPGGVAPVCTPNHNAIPRFMMTAAEPDLTYSPLRCTLSCPPLKLGTHAFVKVITFPGSK